MSDYIEIDPAELGPASLDWLATRLLIELELLSDVSAASLGQHVNTGKPGHKILTMASEPPHLVFKRRYRRCHTDTSRCAVIRDAQDELWSHRHSRSPSVDCQTQDGRRQVGREVRTFGAKNVARKYGFSLSHVYKLAKVADDYDQRYGKRAA